VGAGAGIGPFPEGGWDEALGLGVGFRTAVVFELRGRRAVGKGRADEIGKPARQKVMQ
jgi:hypothetical protein